MPDDNTPIPDRVRLKIDSLSYGPYGVGRDNHKVVFVPLTVPGDEVDVRLEDKGRYAVGALLEIARPSLKRRTAPCVYFGRCGGCPWQHVAYEEQLAAKEKIVKDALGRIGKLKDFECLPIVPSPREYGYRHRLRLQCDPSRRVGFHRSFTHELIEVESCLISEPKVERRIPSARNLVQALKTPLEWLEIVGDDETENAIFVAKAAAKLSEEDAAACERLFDGGSIKGIVVFGRGWRRSWGDVRTRISAGEKPYPEVEADVFTQVNRQGNLLLVAEVLGWGAFTAADRVLELYCGAGNFTLPIARLCREVVAVEGSAAAVKSGEANSRALGLRNIRWIAADVTRALKDLSARRTQKFSKVLLNPPRFGAKGLEKHPALLRAEKILYVSCDPSTLARDLASLTKTGYTLTRVRPFDLFPHTFHVETLAELVR
ncbi:MAG: 23S rRNA (uracil(1939)-C(5))-methyltransferase RlmD [Candidatus Binatia bacterium]